MVIPSFESISKPAPNSTSPPASSACLKLSASETTALPSANAGITASTDQTEIDAYNTAQGTDYKAVPEGAFYQLEDLIFSSGISESVGVLVVDRSKLTKGATYLIPLQLEQSEDLETITSDTKKHYVILKYMFDMVDDKIDLTDKITDPLSCGANSLSFLYDDDTSTAYETKYQSA
ncbi:MAG: DUF1735 domain-containing protein, partial [Clostridiales bacterium]|nr:DUF1735 domain-containing protein [Clostridiales bacterium]